MAPAQPHGQGKRTRFSGRKRLSRAPAKSTVQRHKAPAVATQKVLSIKFRSI
jgi:hypothetical protein